jgi:glycosyltransferase involved in cell wall biosynthesis
MESATHQPTPRVSVLVPLRNERGTLARLRDVVADVLDREGLSFELILVDDGSDDGSFDLLRELAQIDSRVRPLRLRRNFGKAAALATGFRAARGDFVVTIDADLQDDPEEIPRLLALLEEGYGVVSGWKRRRRDPWTRRVASKVFNWATRTVCKIELHDVNCGLKAYTRECALEVADSCYGELHRYLPVVAHWKGFRVAELPVTHHERTTGRSRYGVERYLRGFLDLVTTVFLSRYARRPMHVFGSIGLLSLAAGSVILIGLVLDKIALGAAIGERPLLLFGAVFFVAGLQLVLAGLVAEMISRIPILISRIYAGRTQEYPAVAVEMIAVGAAALDAAALDPAPAVDSDADEALSRDTAPPLEAPALGIAAATGAEL